MVYGLLWTNASRPCRPLSRLLQPLLNLEAFVLIHMKSRLAAGEHAFLDVMLILCNGLQRELAILLVALDESEVKWGKPKQIVNDQDLPSTEPPRPDADGRDAEAFGDRLPERFWDQFEDQ